MASQDNYHLYSAEIDNLLEIKKRKWQLKAVSWIDYDDVAQIIRLHIFKKLEQYNEDLEFGPWCNKIIFNQFRNILRNTYSSYSPPCKTCPMAEGDNCRFTPSKTKCSECPFYAKWEKRKKQAYNVKLPVSLDSGANEQINLNCSTNIDVEAFLSILKIKLRDKLTKNEYAVFCELYTNIQNKNNKNLLEKIGYRQLQNYKHKILKCSKQIILENITDA